MFEAASVRLLRSRLAFQRDAVGCCASTRSGSAVSKACFQVLLSECRNQAVGVAVKLSGSVCTAFNTDSFSGAHLASVRVFSELVRRLASAPPYAWNTLFLRSSVGLEDSSLLYHSGEITLCQVKMKRKVIGAERRNRKRLF